MTKIIKVEECINCPLSAFDDNLVVCGSTSSVLRYEYKDRVVGRFGEDFTIPYWCPLEELEKDDNP